MLIKFELRTLPFQDPKFICRILYMQAVTQSLVQYVTRSLTHIFLLSKSKVFDPGEVLYIYESAAGIGLCVLRVIVSIVFQTILTLVQRWQMK